MYSSKTKLSDVLKEVREFESPSTAKSIFQILNSVIPYFITWTIAYVFIYTHPVVSALSILIAGGLVVRIFIIQHDCGHGSFFKSKLAMKIVGYCCGILTFTPFGAWQKTHSIHHATSGNLDHRGIGDITMLTIKEYEALSPFEKLRYRLIRNVFVAIIFGPFFLFLVIQRIPAYFRSLKASGSSVHYTNIGILILYGSLLYFLDWKKVLLVQLPIMWIAATCGGFLFYVQHQFEETYWERDNKWDYLTASLKGSSFFKLPKILQWFSGNIGFHHVHHFSARIPNYRLEECHNMLSKFSEVEAMTLWEGIKNLGLSLWDEDSKDLISFAEAKRRIKQRLNNQNPNPSFG